MKNYKGKWPGKPSTHRNGFRSLGKNNRKEGQPKAKSKKQEVLKEERLKVSSPRMPRNGKSASGF